MNQHSTLCPLCDQGHLVEHPHERHAELEGDTYVISGLRHSLCNRCGEYVTTPEQSRHNKRALVAARNLAVAERDRGQRLTATDILRIRKTLGLTQAQAARVFGGGPNAFGKYENGEVAPSDGMEKLLRLAAKVPAAAAWLLRRAGLPTEHAVEPPRYREKPRVVLKYSVSESMCSRWPRPRVIGATELASFHVSTAQDLRFTYDSADSAAANDPHISPRTDLATVG